MNELVVSSLRKAYGSVVAIQDISFTVRPGEFLTLLGPSGCGKSTTLGAIAGLERPTSGRISFDHHVLFDGEQGTFAPPEERGFGVVFQSYALWPHMTVNGNVAMPLQLRKVPRAEIRRRVGATLDRVGLAGLADRYPGELSGGQQQRVALARAIVFAPPLLLLDEPLSNLDALLRHQARIWLKEIQRDLGLTSIYVTHDQEEALAMSDRIILMRAGHIVQIGTPEDIYRAPSDPFAATFIGGANLISGTIERLPDGQSALLRLSDGQALAVLGTPAPGPARAAIRAESLFPATRPGASVINAAFGPALFVGNHYEQKLSVAGHSLTMHATSFHPEGQGSASVSAEHIILFPRSGE